MFQFRRFPTYTYLIQCTLHGYCPCGLPHSEISGSQDICSSPKLIAACHVLRRLLMPRHSPCALHSLTSSGQTSYPSLPRKRESSSIPLPLLSSPNPLRWALVRHEVVSLWFSEFELCRLQSFLEIVCFTLKKVPQIIYVSLCCLLFILWLLCSVFKVRLVFC